MSVSLPTRVLLAARLTVRSDLLSSLGGIRDLQLRLVDLAGAPTKQALGVLYPTSAVPGSPRTRGHRRVSNRHRVSGS